MGTREILGAKPVQMPVCHHKSHMDWSGIEPGLQPEPWHSPHTDVTQLFKNAGSNQSTEMWLPNAPTTNRVLLPPNIRSNISY